MIGVLQQGDTSSSGRTGKEGSCSLFERTAQSFVLGLGCLWVRIRGETSTANFGCGVCYRLPDHEEVDEAFIKHLKEAL